MTTNIDTPLTTFLSNLVKRAFEQRTSTEQVDVTHGPPGTWWRLVVPVIDDGEVVPDSVVRSLVDVVSSHNPFDLYVAPVNAWEGR